MEGFLSKWLASSGLPSLEPSRLGKPEGLALPAPGTQLELGLAQPGILPAGSLGYPKGTGTG